VQAGVATFGYKPETEPQRLGSGVLMEMVVSVDGEIWWVGEYEVMAGAGSFLCLHNREWWFSAKIPQPSCWGSALGALSSYKSVS
jgi:hypothetical protein